MKERPQDDVFLGAVKGQTAEEVEALLEAGNVNINAQNDEADTALHIAVKTLNRKKVELLIKHGAQLEEKNSMRITPLHEATRLMVYGYLAREMVAFLVQQGADIFATDGDGKSAFALIVDQAFRSEGEADETLLKLLETIEARGLDLRVVNAEGENALHMVVASDHMEGIKYLLRKGFDVHAVDNRGRTLLHTAAQKNVQAHVILFLIQQGLDPNARDHAGMTPLHCAAQGDALESIKCLVENGAEVKGYLDADMRVKFPIDHAYSWRIRQFFITHALKTTEQPPEEQNKTWTTLPPDIKRMIAEKLDNGPLSLVDKETRRQLLSSAYVGLIKEIKPYNDKLSNALAEKLKSVINESGAPLPKLELFADFIGAMLEDESTDQYKGFLELITQEKYKDLVHFLSLEEKDFPHSTPATDSKSVNIQVDERVPATPKATTQASKSNRA